MTKLLAPEMLRSSTTSDTAMTRDRPVWGLLPELSLVSATGLFLIALAYSDARSGGTWGEGLRWLGLCTLFLPIALRLLGTSASRTERVGLVMILGLGLYIVKVMYSPFEFRFVDELQHWRSTDEIVRAGHLFQSNPILPISSAYPGLQSATAALINMSGLTIFDGGILLMGVIRLLFMLALFLFFEQVSESARTAGIATALYVTNPHFLFLASYYLYQSLAIPLAAFVLFLVVKARQTRGFERIVLNLALMLSSYAVIITHHITGYALASLLVLWALVTSVRRLPDKSPGVLTTLYLVVLLSWMAYVAILTPEYLTPSIATNLGNQTGVIRGTVSLGQIFRPPVGPAWERYISAAAVVATLLALPIGWHAIWQHYRSNPLALTLTVGTGGYLLSLVVRLTSSNGALTVRSWTFLYLAIGFVLAVGIVKHSHARHHHRLTFAGGMALVTLLFLGGLAAGIPAYYGRLPGPYLVGAFERSIETQGVSAAKWTAEVLGPGQRFATDFDNYHLLGSYGRQSPSFSLSKVFFASSLGPAEQREVRDHLIDYLLIDRRFSQAPAIRGFYYNSSEPRNPAGPLSAAAQEKFDHVPNIDRIFDSGDIIIYEVGAWSVES